MSDDVIAFAEKLLFMLDEGRRDATYKFAVLLGLIDVCLEHTGAHGAAPESVTTIQLARKVLELYWPHTAFFPAAGQHILRQNSAGIGKQDIIGSIVAFRRAHAGDPSEPLSRARARAPAEFARLEAHVEWKLVEMPLPKLQRVGRENVPFIYEINWDDGVTKTAFRRSGDNLIRFLPGASENLVRLTGVIRPLVQRQWASMVARLNEDVVQDARLEDFLFGVDRVALAPVRTDLRDLHDDRCFYCDGKLGPSCDVDHFVPWARTANNAIENLVVAHAECNNDKRDHLAAASHVRRWHTRNVNRANDLALIASTRTWETRARETAATARAIYLHLPTSVRLWQARRGEFVFVDPVALQQALVG